MDISLLFRDPAYPIADIAMNGPDLDTSNTLATAVIISLFTDRRAEPDDEPLEADRRGFWGDTYSLIPLDRIGSRLWLLRRQKELQQVANLAKLYCEEALQWLIDDEVVESINVITEIVARGTLGIKVEIKSPEGSEEFTYQYVWNQT